MLEKAPILVSQEITQLQTILYTQPGKRNRQGKASSAEESANFSFECHTDSN